MAAYRSKTNGRLRKKLGDKYIEDIDRRALYELYEKTCGICEEPLKFRDMTLDHIQPLFRGGEHSFANAQPAHGLCNHIKGHQTMDEIDVDAIRAERAKRRIKKAKTPYYNLTGGKAAATMRA